MSRDSALSAAYGRLLPYAFLAWPDYEAAPYHSHIARALEALDQRIITRLIISMPPRHGKTKLCSEYFPAWYFCRHPDQSIIFCTYSQELANDCGRRVRDLLTDNLTATIFPAFKLRPDVTSVERILTVAGGSYYAVGMGGPITGRGADVLIIDDPVKGREEADSELMRNKAKEWYRSVAYTRLAPHAIIVIVSTRWHEDDLAGWILSEHSHEGWRVISFPAIDEEGNALWPKRYSADTLLSIKHVLAAREWEALYQQNPLPDKGGFFKREWFNKEYSIIPVGLTYYGASDYAVSQDGGDYTEHGIFGVDSQLNIYVADWWSGRVTSDKWIQAQVDLIAQYEPLSWIGETGQIRKAIEPYLRRTMNDRGVWCRLDWLSSIYNKEIRARGFQAMASCGKVIMPKHAPWKDDLISQLTRFPGGKYDDKVDTCSLVGRQIVLTGQDKAHVSETIYPMHDEMHKFFHEPAPDADGFVTLDRKAGY